MLNVFDYRFVFFFGSAEDLVIQIFALCRTVGWNNHGFQAINTLELERFRVCRTCHACQFFIQAEIILESNRSQGLVFFFDFHTFFGLNRLMQAIRPTATRRQAACKFVHNHDFTVLHHIMLVFVEQGMGAQSRHQMVHQHDVAAGIQRIAFWQQTQLAQHIFRMLMALLAQADGVVFLIHPVIALAIFFFLTHQVSRHLVHGLIHLNVVVGLTRNDQWRTRFVN